jgi:hypothetical protein
VISVKPVRSSMFPMLWAFPNMMWMNVISAA